MVDSSSASGAIQRRCQADFSAPPPYDEYFFETTFPHSHSALAERDEHRTSRFNQWRSWLLTDGRALIIMGVYN